MPLSLPHPAAAPVLRRRAASRAFSAFSLIEVVIALAVISFSLIPMLGLLSSGMITSRGSMEDTHLAMATQTVVSLLNSGGFAAAATNTSYQSASTTIAFLFDADGNLIEDATGKPATIPTPASYYSCTVTRQTPQLDQATTNLFYLPLNFAWPLSAPTAHQQHRIVPVSLANYD